MEGHRHHHGLVIHLQVALHQTGQGFSVPGPAAIFEAQRDLSRDLAISDGGPETVVMRRIGATGPAQSFLAGVIFEGQGASVAARRPEKAEAGPALEAEDMGLVGDRTAARAARRQREIDNRPDRPAHERRRVNHKSG